jgi:hypothetical protein
VSESEFQQFMREIREGLHEVREDIVRIRQEVKDIMNGPPVLPKRKWWHF